MRENNFTIFSGGTGGHVIPAIIFGNYLIKEGYKCSLFLDKRGMRYSKNFYGKIIQINSGHFSGNIFFKINSIFLLISGFIKSLYHLVLLKPSYCVAFGSYATSTPLLASIILKIFYPIKIFLHEQNSVIGKVNLFFEPFSKNVFLNYKEVININKINNKKIFHVGLPTNQIGQFNRDTIFINKQKIQILVYGGSQSSRNLNRGFLKIIQRIPVIHRKNLYLIIQASDKYKHEIIEYLRDLDINFETKTFFDNFETILSSSDLVISRSGAGTINDIIKFQIPSIIVPLPNSIFDHQFYNAKFLYDKEASKIINENDLGSDKAYLEFEDLLINDSTREKMIKNLKNIKVFNANNLMKNKIINDERN